jgi:DNA-directed RNA polymerase specialized sigma24 family protein
MISRSTQLHISRKPQSTRPRVEELIGRQVDCVSLRRHIGAELKRLNLSGWFDPDDIFQETFTRGLDPNRSGPHGDVLLWLKSIATNFIFDELRKDKLRTGRNVEVVPEHEFSVLVKNSAEDTEFFEAANAYLNSRERQLLQFCRQGLSAEALASASGLPNAKAARDAKWRLVQKLRNLRVALRGE